MNRLKKIFLIVATLFIIWFFVNRLTKNDLEKNILTQETTWTQEIGFVNWGHANSSLTSKKFDELNQLSSKSNTPFQFTYYQNMKQGIGFSKLVFERRHTYEIQPHLSRIEIEQTFLKILVDVSTEFEKMQGSFPIKLIPGASQSSFRNGDMNGNLVSFYSSINNISSKETKHYFHKVSINEALLHLNDSNNWKENLSKHQSSIASKLKKLLHSSNEIELIILEQKTNFYFSSTTTP